MIHITDEHVGLRSPHDGEQPTRALVIHPWVKKNAHKTAYDDKARSPAARLEEAVGLAMAINITVERAELVALAPARPATLLGKGKVAEMGSYIAEHSIDLVIMDAELSPVQQRNLEREWKTKVIDRTGLILEIFGERAATKEGELQVELAHLNYQKSRLVRSWTHLERQRGGFGFIGGPGETQIEADRRIITDRIAQIKRQLETVTRTRELHRTRRQKAPYPVVALVGYTNAGKSTLFNRLTHSDVLAADMLFATLDPTMRSIDLVTGRKVILSDTVGFISDLPTHLIAAFRATLEEVISADLIVHVRDVAHPDSEAQKADVLHVLADLGVKPGEVAGPMMIEALNKIDLLPDDERDALVNLSQKSPHDVPVSALSGAGLDELMERIDQCVGADDSVHDLIIEPWRGGDLSWLHRHGEVLAQSADDEGRTHVKVRIDPVSHAKFLAQQGGDQS
ncbi:GTPase HflX [Iodidimonas nitroreducens]|uniref:GTPase HflX n=1 Tax=Iodidimonas nitroreducens TaxID=1236968 RepID=A0A5A7N7I2_9PROT|nr:GTPase HflX [Iodidimonas nitroreducens]GAK32880.1 GTPase HflX [alpha proteobacterium Q-1]GER03039.1 GTPase HflX [Iodidimonas nitroreducens]